MRHTGRITVEQVLKFVLKSADQGPAYPVMLRKRAVRMLVALLNEVNDLRDLARSETESRRYWYEQYSKAASELDKLKEQHNSQVSLRVAAPDSTDYA